MLYLKEPYKKAEDCHGKVGNRKVRKKGTNCVKAGIVTTWMQQHPVAHRFVGPSRVAADRCSTEQAVERAARSHGTARSHEAESRAAFRAASPEESIGSSRTTTEESKARNLKVLQHAGMQVFM